jgi:hypothetical protein
MLSRAQEVFTAADKGRQADAANQRITDALGVQDTQPESGGEEDDDSAQTS